MFLKMNLEESSHQQCLFEYQNIHQHLTTLNNTNDPLTRKPRVSLPQQKVLEFDFRGVITQIQNYIFVQKAPRVPWWGPIGVNRTLIGKIILSLL